MNKVSRLSPDTERTMRMPQRDKRPATQDSISKSELRKAASCKTSCDRLLMVRGQEKLPDLTTIKDFAANYLDHPNMGKSILHLEISLLILSAEKKFMVVVLGSLFSWGRVSLPRACLMWVVSIDHQQIIFLFLNLNLNKLSF